MGSSPLARGLLPLSRVACDWGGIIPARAGFTAHSGLTCSTRQDHPRSRGVYGFAKTDLVRAGGSSPLARGLPSVRLLVGQVQRIIPARAGFT